MSSKIITFTSHNPLEKTSDENEDAICIRTNFDGSKKLVAISDGAGGVGIYCKEWAEFIVENAPLEMPEFSLDQWFVSISKRFFDHHINNVFSDIGAKEKFISGGSYATILFLWIDYKSKYLHYVGVGDSALFILTSGEDSVYTPSLIFPINDNEFIDQNPTLLNWKKISHIGKIQRVPLKAGDIILAGTDSISRWILENLLITNKEETMALLNPKFRIDTLDLERNELNGFSFRNIEDIFKTIPSEQDSAVEYFKELIEINALDADDITLYAEKII